ncbi:MAG: MetQ/NlpA family ABC transporter substrate-binding protein [Clostridiales bacterium]|nr:MetQ/NlpA family ABC transporter substrate-binding protein [Clostridiales bacterium]
MKISKKLKRIASLLSVGVLILALTGCTAESNADNEIIKVGVVGENNEAWEQVIKNVSKDGIDVELVKFSDYSQVNQALVDGEIDLNSFQHYAYLEKEKEDKGFELSVIGETLIAPLGVYSNTLSDIKDIKVGGKIAIPNDATNEGRALKLLESAGLIKVNEDAGYTPTLSDITENTKNIEFVEVEAGQTARLLPDVDASVINGGHAIDAGLNCKEDAIYTETVEEGSDNPYINVIVANTADKDNETYKKLVDEYRTDEIANLIDEVYQGAYVPTWK